VTALDAISAFGSSLENFRDWVLSGKDSPTETPAPLRAWRSRVRRGAVGTATSSALKLSDFAGVFPERFPSDEVRRAFVFPNVSEQVEADFEWKRPDVAGLRHYASRSLHWEVQKMDDVILPAVRAWTQFDRESRRSPNFALNPLAPQPSSKHASAVTASERAQRAIERLRSAEPPAKKSKTEKTGE
jgi:hypothetical protein